ncbi:bifunctional DRAP deaminase/tRNA pseudouridine synthase RIB2 NDAI_0G02840 [Naumovozyma dairenensis CBS 421]|uniref:Pseudouridine synthase n=1 Tax=Naumovozyma dairenensis (strain ATCC 10597 / BCRC 20456 / CBS 421 / NBRC 0211 / NRRL Y-12639) TaxID=1071378 RepID=G0WE50_NAUDC|nr:hypothetical protein NDAI_0G02840 [Naumovozyma dairenensis CBS 421]CCD26061.2 hypothetical protein NDAI_0G02840 [Naumovozyma dairenensis CBS 421]
MSAIKKKQNLMCDDFGFKLKVNGSQQVQHKKDKTKEQIDPPYEVIIAGPLRKIKPYYFTYKTFCKERWRDHNVLDIFVNEFRDREYTYYEKAIRTGLIEINNKPATLDSIVKNGAMLTHKIHRHEPVVTSEPIRIVFENEGLLVIDKPSGIPVHPTGRFRFNTVTKILEEKYNYVVHPCNRLDRSTSGLMFLAKTPKGADDMAIQLREREVTKEYVARVVGNFPSGEIIVDKPIRSVNRKVSLNAVCDITDEDAKNAKTIFEKISYDGQTSVVKCKPLTGRTHQIRVHLQYLGHPIANDVIYSDPTIWGPTLGRNGIEEAKGFDKYISKLDEIGKTKNAASWYSAREREGTREQEDNRKHLEHDICSVCDFNSDRDCLLGLSDCELWLHAYRYESTQLDSTTGMKKWSYRTPLPTWAKIIPEAIIIT